MSLAKRFLRMVKATMSAVDPSSAVGIAAGESFSHDSVYRVLQTGKNYFSELALEQLAAYGGLQGGYLVLDDSFVMRYGSGKLKLKKLKDSARGGYHYGFNVVLLIWSDGRLRIPVGFRIFTAQPGEASKIALAHSLLEEAQQAGLKPSHVLFDAWYAAQQLLNWLSQAGWLFVTQLRKNRKLDARPLKHDSRVYWVKVGKLSRLNCTVIVVRHQRRYLCSNDQSLDRSAIQKLYRIRQQIEEAFRSLKQDLGWQGMRYRTTTTLTAHLALTLAAYALIELQRSKLKQSFYKFRRTLISARFLPPTPFPHGCRAAA